MKRAPNPALVEALGHYLLDRCLGLENAQPWWAVRLGLQAEGVEFQVIRRYQEAAAVLRKQGTPVIGLSGGGVCIARSVDEVDAALGEKRRRALATLGELRTLKRIRLAMLGQTTVPAARGAMEGR